MECNYKVMHASCSIYSLIETLNCFAIIIKGINAFVLNGFVHVVLIAISKKLNLGNSNNKTHLLQFPLVILNANIYST